MYRELMTFEKRELAEYVSDIFGDDVRSFMKVQSGEIIEVLLLRSISRRGVRRWDSLYVEVTPGKIVTAVHYVDGFYGIEAADENEFRRFVNSWRAPKSARFIGGIDVPGKTREYYFLEVLSDMYFRDNEKIVAVEFIERNGFLVPRRMVVSVWPDFLDEIVDPIARRAIYEGGIGVGVPPELLVKNAPRGYYLAFSDVVGGFELHR